MAGIVQTIDNIIDKVNEHTERLNQVFGVYINVTSKYHDGVDFTDLTKVATNATEIQLTGVGSGMTWELGAEVNSEWETITGSGNVVDISSWNSDVVVDKIRARLYNSNGVLISNASVAHKVYLDKFGDFFYASYNGTDTVTTGGISADSDLYMVYGTDIDAVAWTQVSPNTAISVDSVNNNNATFISVDYVGNLVTRTVTL